MLQLTRKPHTEGMVSLTVVVPTGRADAVTMAIKEALETNVSGDLVFPESSPGKVLRGARGLKEMARKFGRILDFPYKAFL